MAVSKRITYPQKTETKVIKFPNIKVVEKKKTVPIKPEDDWKSGANWWDLEDEDPYHNWEPTPEQQNKSRREGIMRIASLEKDMDRDFYGRLLSPIYKKDYLENLPINELKELFDQYLRDMSIG